MTDISYNAKCNDKCFTIFDRPIKLTDPPKPVLQIHMNENGVFELQFFTDKIAVKGCVPVVSQPTTQTQASCLIAPQNETVGSQAQFLGDREYTMVDAFELWCKTKENTIKSFRDEKKRIENYIMQPLGHLLLTEINAPLVIQTMQDLDKSGKQATLKRILMRLREMLDLAVCAGYINVNPCPRVSKIFQAPKTEHMKSLPWTKISFIIRKVIELAPEQVRDMFLLQLATMCRPNEIANMEKKWIGRDTINIPKEQMKMGREHRIPITPLIRRLIERASSRHPNSPYLFVGRNPNVAISAQTVAKWLHSKEVFKDKLVAHGLRSIARSWMADKGVNFEVAERCLAHIAGNAIQKAYQRSDLLSQRRRVLTEWCGYIEKFIFKYEEKYDRIANGDKPERIILEPVEDEDEL